MIFNIFKNKLKNNQLRHQGLNSYMSGVLDSDNWFDAIPAHLTSNRKSSNNYESRKEIEECKLILNEGLKIAVELVGVNGSVDIENEFKSILLRKYPELNICNLDRIYKRSIYYSTKTSKISFGR